MFSHLMFSLPNKQVQAKSQGGVYKIPEKHSAMHTTFYISTSHTVLQTSYLSLIQKCVLRFFVI